MNPSRVTGTIHFVFTRVDTARDYFFSGNYLLTEDGDKYDLMDNYQRVERILSLCGDEKSLISLALDQRKESFTITDSKLFRSKSEFQSGVHYGGEIFEMRRDTTRIQIVFKVEGIGLLIKSACPATTHPLLIEQPHCEFLEKQTFPILLFTEVIAIYPLSTLEIEDLSLKRSNKKKFTVIYCE